jgi:hypothetical protein
LDLGVFFAILYFAPKSFSTRPIGNLALALAVRVRFMGVFKNG